ncbi:multidrug effflux MFS transporter [Sphingobacterium sp. N143]|uniref:multidrug effflux MFS transporter n=1 Tax=Sphingobacterium sp. N143 TaxID=2746727 RepID=UPI0025756D07|nr:multidrug effflux MFS transporter [Sphingobacterium sp. N143]MDM1293156.1 multidrug effflux MFS transporter [Sphingobacterium sp. N143]
MKNLRQENINISTVLAFALVPISGFAIDVYIPSFPQMAMDLNTSASNIKLTMTIFLLSYGISQLFVGSILDSFGRYKINLVSLLVFTLSCIGIIFSQDISLIFLLRFIQGIAISFIVVSKRVFLVDVYTGEKRKHYTSMLTIVWSIAPIVAPFLGGYLQHSFSWRSNFYFLALYGFVMLLLELKFSGETIQERKSFQLKSIFDVYKKMLSTKEFSLGILVLGLSYAMVMIFGMSIPFIVEHKFQLSSVVSGYSALASGIAIFFGGLFSRYLINRSFHKKLKLANLSQILVALIMFMTAGFFHELLPIVIFAMLLHFWQGFTYNIYFTYSLTRFPEYAATAGGLASGGSYIVFSIASFSISNTINIGDQQTLSVSYLILLLLIATILLVIRRPSWKRNVKAADTLIPRTAPCRSNS